MNIKPDVELDTLVKTMEIMNLTDRATPKEPQGGTQIRNPNFRRKHIHIKQRDQINLVDPNQQIIPPFQLNYVEEEQKQHKSKKRIKLIFLGREK